LSLLRARNAALVASVVAILAFTLVPTAADNDVELFPFADLVDAIRDSDAGALAEVVLEGTANVLLFIPFGAALAFRGVGLGRAACYGLALSLAVEAAQYVLISGRTAAVDDVLLNGLGAVLGHVLLSSWRQADAPSPATDTRGPVQRSSESQEEVEIAAARDDEE
jgi:glycopeptide antibiotics resistance protein